MARKRCLFVLVLSLVSLFLFCVGDVALAQTSAIPTPEQQYQQLVSIMHSLEPPTWPLDAFDVRGCPPPFFVVHEPSKFTMQIQESTYSDASVVKWFAGNFSRIFPYLNQTCLVQYWTSIKATVNPLQCSSTGGSGSFSGSSNSDLPSDTAGPGTQAADPISELMSSILSSAIESIVESSMNAKSGSGSEASSPVSSDVGGGSDNENSLEARQAVAQSVPDDSVPSCVIFGRYAKCLMATKELLRLSILHTYRLQAPACWCPELSADLTHCVSATTAAPPATPASTKAPFTSTPAPSPSVTSSVPTSNQQRSSTPVPSSSLPITSSAVTASSSSPSPPISTLATTATNKPEPTTLPTTATNGQLATTTARVVTTAAPTAQRTSTTTTTTTTPKTSQSGAPSMKTTSSTTQRGGSTQVPTTTTTATAATATQTTATPATTTPAPTRPPTAVEANLTNSATFQEASFKNQIADQLRISPSEIGITRLSNQTVKIEFTGPNAEQNVKDFLKLNQTVFAAMDIASARAAPGEVITPGPTPESSDGKNNAALIAVVIIVVAVALIGGFVLYKYKGKLFNNGGASNNGKGGMTQAFNLDYDEDVMLSGNGNYNNGYEFDNGGVVSGDEMMKL